MWMKKKQKIGPWPDVATARFFLSSLAGDKVGRIRAVPDVAWDWPAVAQWLIEQGIGPLGFHHCQESCPELATHLQVDRFTAVAQSSLYFDSLDQIETTFQTVGIPLVLLKGAALARSAYHDAALRTMSDIDIWVREQDMRQAVRVMQELSYRGYGGREDRPLALQLLAQGEIQFYGEYWGMVELHWSPFPGWWLKRVGAVDDTAVWNRIEAIVPDSNAYQLAAEDMIIQVAVHLAVNHQFGMTAVRGIMDIAFTVKTHSVDWGVVAERAECWRVGTAVWLVLHLLEQLIDMPGLEPALKRLQPSRLRRELLSRYVSPESVLASDDLRSGRARYLLLLWLVDRPRDMVYLIFRTLWPEGAWLEARYQGEGSRWHHLRQIVRYGRI